MNLIDRLRILFKKAFSRVSDKRFICNDDFVLELKNSQVDYEAQKLKDFADSMIDLVLRKMNTESFMQTCRDSYNECFKYELSYTSHSWEDVKKILNLMHIRIRELGHTRIRFEVERQGDAFTFYMIVDLRSK